MIDFGLGLIGIGRTWGHIPGEVPTETDALSFLEYAYDLGVRYFDTAPSYGTSEERLGKFLRGQPATIATKFGEHWDADKQEPYVDHSLEALKRSLDQSMSRLGRVDVLQLHKTNPDVLRSDELWRAWEYAASLGIHVIGPSVSDQESAKLALAEPRYGIMQLPFNLTNQQFGWAVDAAAARGMKIAANRPFAMGAMLYGEQPVSKRDAFAFLLRRTFSGVVLSGTKSREHLQENWQAFADALS